MKFKTPSGRIKGNIFKNSLIISIDKKARMINKSASPIKLTVPSGFSEKYRIKQEIKQTDYKGCVTEGVMQLADIIEEKVISWEYHNANKENWQDWMRVFVYEYLYDVAFNRGIRHERQRRKSKETVLSAFDIIGADDVAELSHELGVSEARLMHVVLEVISKRKNGGMA